MESDDITVTFLNSIDSIKDRVAVCFWKMFGSFAGFGSDDLFGNAEPEA